MSLHVLALAAAGLLAAATGLAVYASAFRAESLLGTRAVAALALCGMAGLLTWTVVVAQRPLTAGPARISTIAGTGAAGFNGDGHPGAQTEITTAGGLAVDRDGAVYFSDTDNNRVRRIDGGGVVTTVAGTGQEGFGGDGGPGRSALLSRPMGLAFDAHGNLYIADSGNNRVRRLTPTNVITTVAGSGKAGFFGDGGQALVAGLDRPVAIAVGSGGEVYVSDSQNHRVRRIATDGSIDTVVGPGIQVLPGAPAPPVPLVPITAAGLAVNQLGVLTVLDTANSIVIERYPEGSLRIAGGTGMAGYGGDGQVAESATFNLPQGVAVADSGLVYIADTGNARIRTIDARDITETIAGDDTAGFSGDGGNPLYAELSAPGPIALDKHGDLYVADNGNHRIRRIRP